MNNQEILNIIDAMALNLKSLRQLVENQHKNNLTFQSRRASLLSLVLSDDWPLAVSEDLICSDSEEDAINRAEGIVSSYVGSIVGDKFLDFGCGDGHVVKFMTENNINAIGYDINCKETDILTTDFEKIKANGPYDTVLLYDVLDHAFSPTSVLDQVKSVITTDSKVLIRFHPWCGRHGGHLVKRLNKAFAHLFLTGDELTSMNIPIEFNQRLTFPIKTYLNWVKLSNFKVLHEEADRTPVGPFFSDNEQIKLSLKQIGYKDFPKVQMELNYFDVILQLNEEK